MQQASLGETFMTVFYYEDIEIGKKHNFGEYEVTKDEVIEFASKWDPQPFHIDEKAAETSIYGGLIASGIHIMAIRTLLLNNRPDRFVILGVMGMDEVRFLHPARVGDRLSVTQEFMEKRESKSKPDRGIVHTRITVTNQNGTPILRHTNVFLIAKRKKATEP